MKFEEYRELAIRTLKKKPTLADDIEHMAIGLGSEINEYFDAVSDNDLVNISEELGDMLWYLGVLSLLLKDKINVRISFIRNLGTDFNWTERLLIKNISTIQNISKRYWVYGKEPNNKDLEVLEQSIMTCLVQIKALHSYFNIDINKTMENNIKKLMIRYPEKYTDANALNRDLESERKELEQ